jgi:Ca2+/Na+ antiporter
MEYEHNKTSRRGWNHLSIKLIISVLVYLMMSFIIWDWNPARWEPFSRGILIFLIIFADLFYSFKKTFD